MNQQDGEVQRLEVGQGRVEAAQQAPGQRHQPVTRVVDLAGRTPPARSQQLGAALGLQELKVRHLKTRNIVAKRERVQTAKLEKHIFCVIGDKTICKNKAPGTHQIHHNKVTATKLN